MVGHSHKNLGKNLDRGKEGFSGEKRIMKKKEVFVAAGILVSQQPNISLWYSSTIFRDMRPQNEVFFGICAIFFS